MLLKSSNVLRRELEKSQKAVFDELQQDIVNIEAVDGVVEQAAAIAAEHICFRMTSFPGSNPRDD